MVIPETLGLGDELWVGGGKDPYFLQGGRARSHAPYQVIRPYVLIKMVGDRDQVELFKRYRIKTLFGQRTYPLKPDKIFPNLDVALAWVALGGKL